VIFCSRRTHQRPARGMEGKLDRLVIKLVLINNSRESPDWTGETKIYHSSCYSWK